MAAFPPHGEMGQTYLASSKNVGMRLWEAVAPGDSWVVPAGAAHAYRVLAAFTAVE